MMLPRLVTIAAIVFAAAAVSLAVFLVATAGAAGDGSISTACPTAPGDLSYCV